MTEMDKKRVKDLYESGMPLERIYRIMSVKRSEFRSAINDMRKNGEIPTKRNTEEFVIKAFDDGMRGAREIAAHFGIKERTVYIYLNRNNRFFGKKVCHSVHCERTNEIVCDIKQGNMNITQIAKKHGVSRQYVSKLKEKVERGVFGD